MKAMILAAGLGTRLRPLTNDRPKALVDISGHTLLEITIARLRQVGVTEIIVNTHHFAGQVTEYLKANNNFGLRIEVSQEDVLLDTGGGLKKAAWFFREGGAAAPFILHNVDVLSNIDLKAMVEEHDRSNSLATLAVQKRDSSRYLLFDQQMQLCGRRFVREDRTELVRPKPDLQALAFSGIHVISPRLLELIAEDGVFSIVETYLRLAGLSENGYRITGYLADGAYWRDLGRRESVEQAARDVKVSPLLSGLESK